MIFSYKLVYKVNLAVVVYNSCCFDEVVYSKLELVKKGDVMKM